MAGEKMRFDMRMFTRLAICFDCQTDLVAGFVRSFRRLMVSVEDKRPRLGKSEPPGSSTNKYTGLEHIIHR